MSKSKVRRSVTQKTKGEGMPQRAKVSPLRRHRLTLTISLFLIVATLIVFWQVQHHKFLTFDDDDYVTNNPYVKAGLTLSGVTWASTTTHASNWHPLTWLSHMLDSGLYGLNAGGHHVTNLLFHIANALLLFLVLKRMTGALWKSGFVAALFALHPLHVESVAWVAERKDVLSTFFWMLTMWAYVRYSKGPSLSGYLLVLLCFGLGLLSKPMLVTLPFVMLLLDYWPLGRFHFGQPSGDHSSPVQISLKPGDQSLSALYLVLEKIPFIVLSVASSFLTFFAQEMGGTVKSLEVFPLETRIANAFVSYITYIGKMIWPRHLAVLYPYPDKFPIWQVAGAILLLVGVTILVVRAGRRHPYFLVGWFWYLGTLVPVIGLVQVGMQAMADRYTYVPLIGLFIMVAWGFPNILKEWRFRKMALGISEGLLLLILMTLSWFQVQRWQSNSTLFNHTLEVTANNFLIHNKLGNVLFREGRIDEAMTHYAEALRINPHFVEAKNNIGNILFRQGRIDEAMTHYAEALQRAPDYADAHNNLGVALFREGKIPEAVAHYAEALKINPAYPEAHYNLGVGLARQGKIQEAAFHFSEALRIKPDYAEACSNLANALAEQGRIEEAIVYYAEALRIRPDFAEARYNLGNTLFLQGKVQEAIAQYTGALRTRPDFSEAHYSLGLAYWMIGNRTSALKEYEILKTVNPDLASALSRKILK